MAINTGNSDLVLVTTKRVFPQETTNAGTVSSADIEFYGVGTAFLSTIKEGDWVFDMANNEKRRIVSVQSDILAKLELAFSTPLAAAAYVSCPGSRFVEIAVASTGAGSLINGVAIPANLTISWGKTSRSETERGRYIDPIIVDGTTGNVLVETLR